MISGTLPFADKEVIFNRMSIKKLKVYFIEKKYFNDII
jgi:hypothetical protein